MAGDMSMSCLDVAGVSKAFPGVIANENVSLQVAKGEIHALIGENGAGKSTLVKIIYGLQKADSGHIRFNGQEVAISSPKAARKLGIGMVFQHFSLFEAMTVLENIALGLDEAIPPDVLEKRVADILATYSLPLDPQREVHTLSVGERQRIEIVRCLLQNPKLLIMDEPTSVLTPQEAERLFATLRRLAADGCAILYISHKLDEIKALCERATILRGGKVVGACDPRVETTKRMAEMMIGAELRAVEKVSTRSIGREMLKVESLNLAPADPSGIPLKAISLTVHAGEILGIAGVAGNGQAELLKALSGEDRSTASAIILDGRACGDLGPNERRALGLCVAPEERNGHAACGDFSLADNVVLTARDRMKLQVGSFLKPSAINAFASLIIERFGVKAKGIEALARSLSGGNLQKFIMGREILQNPSILIVAQPTWGVDAGAASTIHQALNELAGKGTAIIIISQDLDELLLLSDSIAVINEGRLSAARDVAAVTIAELGMLMGGVHGAKEHGAKEHDAKEEAAHAQA